jgi:hypothetical protein
MHDLADVWAEKGKAAMEQTAALEPAKFVAICAGLIPKDVSVTLSARLPGNLELEDYSTFQELLQAAKQAIPDVNSRQPGDIANLMLTALRSHLSTALVNAGDTPQRASEGQTESQKS